MEDGGGRYRHVTERDRERRVAVAREAVSPACLCTTMSAEAQREDLPRISVETLDDWRRIKRNYTIAALTALDEQLSGNNSSEDREVLLAHLHRVCSLCV